MITVTKEGRKNNAQKLGSKLSLREAKSQIATNGEGEEQRTRDRGRRAREVNFLGYHQAPVTVLIQYCIRNTWKKIIETESRTVVAKGSEEGL